MYSWVLLCNPFLRIFVLTDALRLLMFKVIRVELISTMFVNCFLFVAFILCSFFFLSSTLFLPFEVLLEHFILFHFLLFLSVWIMSFSLFSADCPTVCNNESKSTFVSPCITALSESEFAQCVQHLVTPWTVAYHSPFVGFSRQKYWSGLPFPSPGDLPNPGIEPGSPTLQVDASLSEPPGKT